MQSKRRRFSSRRLHGPSAFTLLVEVSSARPLPGYELSLAPTIFFAPWFSLFLLIPIAVFIVGSKRWPNFRTCYAGAAFGAVVSPSALGLYSLYFISPWGIAPGMLGLILTLIHGAPGFELAITFGLIPRGVVSGLWSHVIIESLNGVVWGLGYGLLGLAIDRFLSRRSRRLA